jgi:hypothetical protein
MGMGPFMPTWSYAYAYGNLFNDQLTVSAGLLGESPWGTGGPNLRFEPETRIYTSTNHLSGEPYTVSEGLIGVRVEYKPAFVPGLNVGFVLNQPDQSPIAAQDQTFGDIRMESVIGASYENDYFAARVGFRLDGKADSYAQIKTDEGNRLTYRVEERMLRTVADGMQVWLNGIYYGLGNTHRRSEDGVVHGGGEYLINWLYWLWDTDSFTAKLDIGFSVYKEFSNMEIPPGARQEYLSLEFHPAFYYKFFDNLLQAGLGAGIGMEFGEGKTYKESPYQYFFIEPQVRLNIGGNAYLALVYNYTDKYAWPLETGETPTKPGDKSQKHQINLRAVYTF